MGKGRTPCCEKGKVKKGPWSQEEDMKLISFIQRHGHSNWRSLPMLAGLARCGKSCRLRWVNYLRPDVKRGSLTPDEEETVIKLQSLIGNKWSKIASHLPGRTDNEIKNIWNTHLKKRATEKKSSKTVTKSTEGEAAASVSPKDDGNIEFSSSDCATRYSYNYDMMIDVTRKIPYEEPILVDMWDSLMLDAGNQYDELNPNIHDCDGKGETSMVNKKDMQGGSSSFCPFGLLNNFEVGKINYETTTSATTTEIVDDQQMSKTYQLQAFPNELEIMAWPSSPTCYSFSGF